MAAAAAALREGAGGPGGRCGSSGPPGPPGPALSRLPVRGARAKRPAAEQEAALPAQKRARPAAPAAGSSVAARVGGGNRAPLKAISVAAAARAGPPRKAATTAAAPRAGAPPAAPSAPPRSRRPPWDLKGQVQELRGALGGARERLKGLEGENRDLQERLEELQGQLGAAGGRETQLGEQLRALSAELWGCREELGRWRGEAQALEASKEQLEQQGQRRQQELEAARGELGELGARLEEVQAQLQGAQQALQAQAQVATELRAALAAREQQQQLQETRLHRLEMERRRLHNLVLELKGNIRVFCRVRPVLPEEQGALGGEGLQHLHFPPHDPQTIVLTRPEESHVGRERRPDTRYDFSFDRVFPPDTSQRQVFQEIALLVQSALDGYHVCIFAYGQTGSGKTYTLEGPDPRDPQTRGVIPRAVGQLFQGAQELAEKGWQYDFSASFLEIYNESLRDLLAPERGPDLEIRRVSAASEELHVPNLTRVPVTCQEEVLGVLQRAGGQRAVARTALNDRSSRSHGVFQLHIKGVNPGRDLQCCSVLSLVDLAGSERLARSLARGERLRETQNINTSLSALGRVISALANKEPHVPYRNSKLTYLLQNSLGGSAKMLMFVNISPLEENFTESLNSLRFASKVNECVVGTAHANRK